MAIEISVIIPSHNVEKTLEKVINQTIDELKGLKGSYEVIIAEDGSIDKTYDIAKKLSKNFKHLIIFHSEKRLGKGKALNLAFKKAKGRIRIFLDADYVGVPKFIPQMSELLKECDIVIGTRYKNQSKTKRLFRRLLASRFYIILVKLFFFLPFSDLQCGFKGMNKKVIQLLNHVKSKDYFWDTEFLVKAKKAGYSICELPISWVEMSSKHSASLLRDSFKFIMSLIKLRRGIL